MKTRPSPFFITLTLAVAFANGGCSSPHPIEREVRFEDAMKIEFLEDSIEVDGEPASAQQLRERIQFAHEKHGGGDRIAAVVIVRILQRAGEGRESYEKRCLRRADQVIEELRVAGVRDIRVGPLNSQRKPQAK